MPPEALSWNDADDNNAYHEKLFVMDLDGTLSTELASIKNEQAYYHEMAVMGLPNRNDGGPMPAYLGAGGGFIPKGSKGVAVSKDFMKYFMQPQVMNENLKTGLGRYLPVMPQVVKDDPWWLDPKDPFRSAYVQEGVLGPPCRNTTGTARPGVRSMRAALGQLPCRCHQERDDAGGRGGQGVQAGRGDLCEIHLRVGRARKVARLPASGSGKRKLFTRSRRRRPIGQQGRRAGMSSVSRRSMIRGSLVLRQRSLARPYVANAAGDTATVW